MAATLTTETVRRPRLRRLRSARRQTVRADRSPEATPAVHTPRTWTNVQLVAGGLSILAALLAGFAGYLIVGSGLQADRQQDVMYDQLRSDLSAMTVPYAGLLVPGTPLGVIHIPAIGLDQVFVAGSSAEQTRNGPGLKPDSVLPGQGGFSALVGHRSTLGAAFAHLDDLRPGDRIEVTTGQGKFTYVVDLVRTTDAPAVQIPTVPSRLTLVTSDPAYVPNRELWVSARLDGDALPTSTGQVATAADQPGQRGNGSLVGLLLWSQVLLAATVAVTWTALRYPSRGLWIGAAPVLLAVLWQVYENLALLMPNTL